MTGYRDLLNYLSDFCRRIQFNFYYPVAIILSCVIGFFYTRKPNIPIMDDYDAILNFLVKWETNSNNRFELLISPHNEHPLLIPKIVVLIQYQLMGEVNFQILAAVSQLMLIVLSFLMLWIQFNLQQRKFVTLIFLCILNFGLGTVLVWPMSGLQHISTVLISTLTLFLFSDDLKRLPRFKWVVLYMACFTGGASLIILVILFTTSVVLNKTVPKLLMFHATVILFIYFKYVHAPIEPQLHFTDASLFLLHFLGNPFGKFLSPIFGLIFVILTFFNYKKLINRKNLFFFQIACLNIGIGAGAALTRNSFGPAYGDEEKYFLYAVMCWLMIFSVTRDEKLKTFSLSKAIYCVLAIYIFSNSVLVKLPPIINVLKVNSVFYPQEMRPQAIQILEDARRLGIYNFAGVDKALPG